MDETKVLRGRAVFAQTCCTSCHAPKSVTGRLEGRPERGVQLISPLIDVLLHDIGPGPPAGSATGSEWQPAPPRGLGPTEQIAGRRRNLHEGRARCLPEAIL